MLKIQELFKSKDHFYIFTHISPDGDALGSVFGLKYALMDIGKEATVVLDQKLPEIFDFLGKDYLINADIPASATVVALDCGDRARIAGLDSSVQVDISVDHHQSREDFAKAFYVDDKASATAEILLEIILGMGNSLNKRIAACLYTGIVTDTGGFRYSNTTSKTHRYAAHLLDTGIDGFLINKLMFETKSLHSLQADAFCVEKMEFFMNNKVAVSCISKQERAEHGFNERDMDGLSSITRSVEGVEIGAFLWEKDNGKIQGGLRSNGDYDVGKVAKQFGGGGHKNASGFGRDLSMQEVKDELLKAFGEIL